MKKIMCLAVSIVCIITLCGCDWNFLDFDDYAVSEVQNTERYFYNGVEINISDENVTRYAADDTQAIKADFCSSYMVLNNEQKRMYRIFFNAAEQMPEGFIDFGRNNSSSQNDLMLAYRAMLNDNPHIFWMPNSYVYGVKTVKGQNNSIVAFKYSKQGYSLDYSVNKSSRDKMRMNLENVVNFVLKHSDKLGSEFEKELFFNDYIRENTKYDLNSKLRNTSYGCLVDGQALCEGYSKAFQLLCKKSDIQCDLVVGTSENQGHMWNCVNIGGAWNYIDVTWNDIEENLTYAYFNITEKQLLKDHSLSPFLSDSANIVLSSEASCNYERRDCSSVSENYYIISGYVFDNNYSKMAKEIDNMNEINIKKAEYMFINDSDIDSFNKNSNAILQMIQNKLWKSEITSYSIIRDVLVIYWK